MSNNYDRWWDVMEDGDPETWPGAQPWADGWGSFGTTPDQRGLGATVMRTRVPTDFLPQFWSGIRARYPSPPRFSVGPRDTPGLREWLARQGYALETEESVLALPRADFDRLTSASGVNQNDVRQVGSLDDLRQVIALDHLVFGDPLLDGAELQSALERVGGDRMLWLVPGPDMALVTGGATVWSRWALLRDAETHPDHRGRGFYRQMVAVRLRWIAARPEVEFAAVYANDRTSAPILTRMGFEPIGRVEVWKPPGPE